MKLKDLSKKTAVLSKAFGIDGSALSYILELLEKGKIAKPGKLFKDSAPKLDVKGLKPFVYLNMGQKNYFFYGTSFPLGSDLSAALTTAQKTLSKTTKEADKENLEAQILFLEELEKTAKKSKGYAFGSIRFARLDEATKECFMAVKTGVKVNGKTKKKSLAEDIKNIGYDLLAKSGHILRFETVTDEEETPAPSSSTSAPSSASETSDDANALKATVKTLVGSFKNIKDVAWPAISKADAKSKVKAVIGCWDEIQALLPQIADFIKNADGNSSLTKELEAVKKINTNLEGYATKLKPTVESIKAKQGEKSNAALDSISADINAKIAELLGSFDSEIASIDGLKAKLEGLKSLA
ncbi:hypothetical protein [Aureispira anguillae]|uniref:Uncharacterized protein n=1 Tax=Aureispira anguillae TaxID=2864201 RepID=A0A915VME8_9BACT|nr:hypothetical protein [Aureispira anguillae]BDS09355.1 hypothetical protein AsAng_0000530 [Aureispira anguillae]